MNFTHNSTGAPFWHVQTLSPPVVRHVPPAYARPDAAVTLDLSATCSSGSCAAEVYYRESPATMADSAPLQDGLVEDPQWARVAMRQTAALILAISVTS